LPHLIDKQVQQKYLLASIFLTFILTIYLGLNDAKGQGVIKGVITDAKTHETIVGANVILQGTTMGASSDLDGNYEIKNIPEGTYNVVANNGKVYEGGLGRMNGPEVGVPGQTALVMWKP